MKSNQYTADTLGTQNVNVLVYSVMVNITYIISFIYSDMTSSDMGILSSLTRQTTFICRPTGILYSYASVTNYGIYIRERILIL